MHLLVASEIYNVYEVLFYKHSSIYTSYTLEIAMAQEGGNCLPKRDPIYCLCPTKVQLKNYLVFTLLMSFSMAQQM